MGQLLLLTPLCRRLLSAGVPVLKTLIGLSKPESYRQRAPCTVERIWKIWDSQCQILALAFRLKSLKPIELFALRSKAFAGREGRTTHISLSSEEATPSKVVITSAPRAKARIWA